MCYYAKRFNAAYLIVVNPGYVVRGANGSLRVVRADVHESDPTRARLVLTVLGTQDIELL